MGKDGIRRRRRKGRTRIRKIEENDGQRGKGGAKEFKKMIIKI